MLKLNRDSFRYSVTDTLTLLSGKEAKGLALQQFVSELGLPLIVSLADDPTFKEPALNSALKVAHLKAQQLKRESVPLAAGADTAFYVRQDSSTWSVNHQLQRKFEGRSPEERQKLRTGLVEKLRQIFVKKDGGHVDLTWVNAISVINGTGYGFPQTALLRVAAMTERQFNEFANYSLESGLIDTSNAGGALIETITAHELIRSAAVYDYLDFAQYQPEVRAVHQPNSEFYELLSQAVLSSVPLRTSRLQKTVATF